MKAIQGYHVIKPEDLHWRPSNLMKIPTRIIWSGPAAKISARGCGDCRPKARTRCTSISALEEFYFVVKGTGRMRVGDETLTVPKYGGVLVGPDQLRQVFNDTEHEVSGSSSGHRRNWNFCKARNSRSIFR